MRWALDGSPRLWLWALWGYLAANGGQFVTPDLRKADLASPANITTLQFFVDMVQKQHLEPKPGESPAHPFFAGELAMRTTGSWEMLTVRQGVHNNFTWDILRMPFGTKGKRSLSAAGGSDGITPHTKYPDEAWTWIKHFDSTEGLDAMLGDVTQSIPGRQSSARRWQQTALAGKLPPAHVGVFLEMLKEAVPLPNMPYYDEVSGVIGKPLNDILFKAAPIQATLQQLDQQIDQIIAKYSF